MNRRTLIEILAALPAVAAAPEGDPFAPRGEIHIPIGIPNTLDPLKTFVEAEGSFSPGVGTYGVYLWLYDLEAATLSSPAFEGTAVKRGLAPGGLPIPWTSWSAGNVEIALEICEVERPGPIYVTAARARVVNSGRSSRKVAIYIALRPVGPAGWNVHAISVGPEGDALLVDGHPAIVASRKPASTGVAGTDTIGAIASAGRLPEARSATSPAGNCSGALRFDLTLQPRREETLEILCPVLPGRRAARHQWVDLKQNAMVDAAAPNPKNDGIPQPDPGLPYYRTLRVARLFEDASRYWREFLGGIDVHMPDPRWGESMRAILAHAALCMNEGAPDVAVVNYNVFNRDGVYIANIMQKSGLRRYSEQIVDFFIGHPFNGRAHPEADNPGQILWTMHEHWLLTRDASWLRSVYPQAAKLARMIRYYRTSSGPHWVAMDSLEFGSALPEARRRELKPGHCDGYHPEYTEAFDIAGLRGAAGLAAAVGAVEDAREWRRLAGDLFTSYDGKFGGCLPRQYGSYSVLWPCRLYPLEEGKAFEQFRNFGAQVPESWRYFPLATAHQGLLAGNRAAGHRTLSVHLSHEQMRGWYAFDEGGGSGSGGWHHLRTTWTHSKENPGNNRAVAMPHGWAIAEFWLLMRDSIAFEDGERLVLLAGVPPDWFRAPEGMRVRRLATYFGPLDLDYRLEREGAELRFTCSPPHGYILRLPPDLRAKVYAGGKPLEIAPNGDCVLPRHASPVRLRF